MAEALRLSYRSNILDYLLKEGENIGIVHANTNVRATGKVDVYFFRVVGRAPLNLEYREELPVIPAGEKLDYGVISKEAFNGSEEDDYFKVSDPFIIYHMGVGIYPDRIRLFKMINGVPQQTLDFDLQVTPDKDHSFIDGMLSPYDEPKAISQEIVVKGVRIRYGLKNTYSFDVQPVLKFLGAMYVVQQITDDETINKIIEGKIPCRFEPLGWLTPFTFTKPDEWKEATEVDINKVSRRW